VSCDCVAGICPIAEARSAPTIAQQEQHHARTAQAGDDGNVEQEKSHSFRDAQAHRNVTHLSYLGDGLWEENEDGRTAAKGARRCAVILTLIALRPLLVAASNLACSTANGTCAERL
jgi:hypothetical protein